MSGERHAHPSKYCWGVVVVVVVVACHTHDDNMMHGLVVVVVVVVVVVNTPPPNLLLHINRALKLQNGLDHNDPRLGRTLTVSELSN